MKKINWERQEAGWYTARNIGGICYECIGMQRGWYFYPLSGYNKGPFKTLNAVKKYVEKYVEKKVK